MRGEVVQKPHFGRLLVALFVMVVIAAIAGSTAHAATFTVCSSGCDYTTIQEGIDAAAASGDTVTIAAGTYAENVTVDKSVTITGAGSSQTTISGSGSGYGITLGANASGTTIQNLTVQGFVRGIDTESSGVNNVTISGVKANNNTGYGFSTGNSAVASGWTLNGVSASGNAAGFRNRGQLTGLTVTNSHFDGNSEGWDCTTSSGQPAVLSQVSVSNSTFNNNSTKGMYFECLDHASFSGVQVEGSGTSGSAPEGVDINLKYASYSTISFTNSTISGSTGAGIYVKGRNDGSYASPPASLSDVTLTGNAVTGNAAGVIVENNVTGVTLHENDLSGNSAVSLRDNRVVGAGGIASADQIDATDNWWGSASGPGSLVGNINDKPWATDTHFTTLSNNADLVSMSLSSGSLSPAFSVGTTSYTASVDNSVTSVNVTDTVNPGANAVTSGGSNLTVGSNTVTVTVTSADGSATKTYTVTVTRAAPPLSTNADLASLSLSSGSLTPAFSPSTTNYTASVDNGTTSVTVSQTTASGASAVVNGGGNLAVGSNTVTITVTAQDSTHTKIYTITVTRAAAPSSGGGTTPPPPPPTSTTPSNPAPPTPNQAESASATPDHSGSVAVVVAPTSPAPGTTTPSPPVTVAASWPAGTFTTPVNVQVTPKPELAAPAGGTPTPIAGGFSVSSTVFQLTVTNSSTGSEVTAFAAPFVFHVSALPAGEVPAYSHDGNSWTTIPQLTALPLPAGQPDGYYQNADGSVDIYTRHATFFGLLKDTQAPSAPKLTVKFSGKKLYLTIRGAKDNVRVTGYRLSFNGRLVKNTPRSYLVLSAQAGRYQVLAVDAAGNRGKPTLLTVVGNGSKHHPFRKKG